MCFKTRNLNAVLIILVQDLRHEEVCFIADDRPLFLQVRCFVLKRSAVFHCNNYFGVDLIAAVYVYKLFHKHFLQRA